MFVWSVHFVDMSTVQTEGICITLIISPVGAGGEAAAHNIGEEYMTVNMH